MFAISRSSGRQFDVRQCLAAAVADRRTAAAEQEDCEREDCEREDCEREDGEREDDERGVGERGDGEREDGEREAALRTLEQWLEKREEGAAFARGSFTACSAVTNAVLEDVGDAEKRRRRSRYAMKASLMLMMKALYLVQDAMDAVVRRAGGGDEAKADRNRERMVSESVGCDGHSPFRPMSPSPSPSPSPPLTFTVIIISTAIAVVAPPRVELCSLRASPPPAWTMTPSSVDRSGFCTSPTSCPSASSRR